MNANTPDRSAQTPVAETGPFVGLSKVNATRSLLMMAFAAILGLAIAGFGLFTAKGTTSSAVPPEDVALVNDRPVLVSDFIAQVEAETSAPFAQATEAQRRKVLNDMIREELYVQRGLELDFPASDPDTRAALVAAVEQQVVATVTAQQATEAALRAYYEANKAKYSSEGTMTLTELVLPGPASPAALAKAGEAVAALRAGTPIEAASSRFGLQPSGRMTDGEEFYFAAKIHLGPALFAAAAALPSGAVSAPLPAADGVHILVMGKNNQPIPLSFEAAREKVSFDMKKEQEAKLQDADEQFLRSKGDIKLAKDYR